MATETKDKKPTAGNLRALFKNQSWLKTLRKRMGLGDTLGPLGEEFGGTGGNKYAPFSPLLGGYLFGGKNVQVSMSEAFAPEQFANMLTLRETESSFYLLNSVNANSEYLYYSILKCSKQDGVLSKVADSAKYTFPVAYSSYTFQYNMLSKPGASEGVAWRIQLAGRHDNSSSAPFYVGFLTIKVTEDDAVSTSFAEASMPCTIARSTACTRRIAAGKTLDNGSFATFGAVSQGTSSSASNHFIYAAKMTGLGALVGIGKMVSGENNGIWYFINGSSDMEIVTTSDSGKLKTMPANTTSAINIAILTADDDFTDVSILDPTFASVVLTDYLFGDGEVFALSKESISRVSIRDGVRTAGQSEALIPLVSKKTVFRDSNTAEETLDGVDAREVMRSGSGILLAQFGYSSGYLVAKTTFVDNLRLRVDSGVGSISGETPTYFFVFNAIDNGVRVFAFPTVKNVTQERVKRIDIVYGGN